jgi:hypothetical protein
MIRYVLKVVRWEPVAVTSWCAAMLMAWSRWAPTGWPRLSAVSLLAIAAALVAVGLAFCLDDPAGAILDTTPVSAARRRMWHLLAGGSAATAGWVVTMGVAPPPTPVGWASAMAAGIAAFALAVGALAARVAGPAWGGTIGAVGVVLARVLLGGWHHRLGLDPTDVGAPVRWLVVTAVCVGLLGMASRDPGTRRAWR